MDRIPRKCVECGADFSILQSRIDKGHGLFCSMSCSNKAKPRRHGHTRVGFSSRTYTSWQSMRQRCENPKATKYPAYGAKGITVCDHWSVFDNFLADMGERPDGHTLDRIDGKGNYEPSNCRWATPSEQQSNISTGNFVSYKGEIMRITDLSRLLGIQVNTLSYRISRGWPEAEWDKRPKPTGR